MAVDVVMPKMGESIMEGTILTWHKKPGDKVERDETILEISTDKVDTEVPSPESGTITEILYNEGDVVGVGNVIARIDTGNGSVSSTTHQTRMSRNQLLKDKSRSRQPKNKYRKTIRMIHR